MSRKTESRKKKLKNFTSFVRAVERKWFDNKKA
jgi:hypothetical protein